MNNCHGAAFNAAYIKNYLAPVSAAVAAAAAAAGGGGSASPFIFADPYFEPRSGGGCLNDSAYSGFWHAAFDAAPAFSLIAPQDGVGAHNLSSATVREFFGALRSGSHAAAPPRKFGALVELFEQHPLNGSHFQPSCEHRRRAPFARIVAQQQNEAPFVDYIEFTAWEWLYQLYKRYVDGLFEARPMPLKGDDGERARRT